MAWRVKVVQFVKTRGIPAARAAAAWFKRWRGKVWERVKNVDEDDVITVAQEIQNAMKKKEEEEARGREERRKAIEEGMKKEAQAQEKAQAQEEEEKMKMKMEEWVGMEGEEEEEEEDESLERSCLISDPFGGFGI